MNQVGGERDPAESGRARMAAGGDGGEGQHGRRARPPGSPARGDRHRRQQQDRHRDTGVSRGVGEQVVVQGSAADPAAGVRRVGERRDDREQRRRATDRDRDPPLPAANLGSAVIGHGRAVGDEPAAGLAPPREQRGAEDAAAEQDQRTVERRVEQRAQPAAVGERAGRRGHGGADHRGPDPERVRALDRVPVIGRDRVPPHVIHAPRQAPNRPQHERRRAVAGQGRAHDHAARGGQRQRAQRSVQRLAERDRDRRRRPGDGRARRRGRLDRERVRRCGRRNDQQRDQRDD